MKPLAFVAASPQPSHIGFRSRFIDENQFGWVEVTLAVLPNLPRYCNVFAVLLAGSQRLFLYEIPISLRT
jgi:hypothetical protein